VVYSADTGFTGGSVGSKLGTTMAGAYTTEQELFQTRRITAPSYAFSVTNGAYLVTLKFAELVFNAAGQRVFNITMEGATVDSNVDIFARTGGSAIAYDKTYAVNVTDGQLNIGFTIVTQDTQVSGIVVRSATIVTAPSLVGQWEFNEGAGITTVDRSGNGLTGTLSGSPPPS
jgi:Malectin domain